MTKGIRNFLQLGGRKKSSIAEVEVAEPSVRGEEAGAGSLNCRKQLEAAYESLLRNEGAGEDWRKAFFRTVRVLVLGRSGAGKSTLIRLMVGNEGPQAVAECTAGVQNIHKEFIYASDQEQGVPLIFHDSNGMDVQGKKRVDEIMAFLEKHQNGGDFMDRIHIVWYVISAIDNRCVNDGDVMKLISTYKIPLLLIMTHCDYEKLKVTNTVLDQLLQSAYPEDEEREAVKKGMVKLCNEGVSMGAENELVVDGSKRDTKGLKLVVKRTRQLIDKRLRYKWIAAQAVDMDAKLKESAGMIAGYARRALFTSLPRVIPLADPLKLFIIFSRVFVILVRIWVVPPALKQALMGTLMHTEATWSVMARVGQDLAFTASLILTMATAGLAFAAVKPGLTGSYSGLPVTVMVKVFSLKVLGTILYVKSAQAGRSRQRWMAGVSGEQYVEQCEEFLHNAQYQQQLLDFAQRQHSSLDTAVRKRKVQGMMRSQIVEIYCRLLLHRPTNACAFSHTSKLYDDTLNNGQNSRPIFSEGEVDEGDKGQDDQNSEPIFSEGELDEDDKGQDFYDLNDCDYYE